MPQNPKRTTSGKRPKCRRPRATHRRVTPAVWEIFSELYLKGKSVSEVARATGFNRKTVDHHLKQTIMPLWQSAQIVELGIELAKVDLLERVAWEMFSKSTEPLERQRVKDVLRKNEVDSTVIEQVTTTVNRVGEVKWLKIIMWCLDFRAKVGGLYAEGNSRASGAGPRPKDEMRCAGMSPEDVDEKMLTRILEGVERRRARARQAEQGVPIS